MLKLRMLPLVSMLMMCLIVLSGAAPSRTNGEDLSDGVSLSKNEAETLLRAMKDFMEMSSDEKAEQETDGDSDAAPRKRACNTATCVTHRLADYLSRSGGMGYSNFVPTNVGAQAFGRKKRHGLEKYFICGGDKNKC